MTTPSPGSPRCTGLWAWGENHGRVVELYRESIEASQVGEGGGRRVTVILQGRGHTFLSWRCSYSYSQMIANSEACPWDGSSTLVSSLAIDTLTPCRCPWVRTPWWGVALRMASTS